MGSDQIQRTAPAAVADNDEFKTTTAKIKVSAAKFSTGDKADELLVAYQTGKASSAATYLVRFEESCQIPLQRIGAARDVEDVLVALEKLQGHGVEA